MSEGNVKNIAKMDYDKFMDVKEFREKGFLQEVNRLFFHPLGLSLTVAGDDVSQNEELLGIVDERCDPDGTWYGKGVIDQDKIDNVMNLRDSKRVARQDKFGTVFQRFGQ